MRGKAICYSSLHKTFNYEINCLSLWHLCHINYCRFVMGRFFPPKKSGPGPTGSSRLPQYPAGNDLHFFGYPSFPRPGKWRLSEFWPGFEDRGIDRLNSGGRLWTFRYPVYRSTQPHLERRLLFQIHRGSKKICCRR